ncbi:TPA: indolepyruvate oxidoreductase subunit beta [candidate division WOR-3]|uniref:Indolepyruvate oxidoreductase subunit beta n=2 Tax=Bacteria candidate phyla TaxID=1783234 RepID=A0A348MJN5_UNCW3|nr:indolepyruvate oxidoreductase subunit beta [candidate division WOR-3 bacterium]HCP16110.1 indolepyruvate oxidoreductase subunit beta [candidate division WOR-3 bacterium]
MMENKRVIIAGVGGQGILLASDLLSDALMKAGFDVKKSEVHGMSQRGGDVVSHIVFGEKVYSPLISFNEADVILAFEKIESLRNIDFLKDDGIMIINSTSILPLPVAAGLMDYPEDPIGEVKKFVKNTYVVDAEKIAKELGNRKVMNVVLLGFLAKNLKDIEKRYWEESLKERLPEKIFEVNLQAFNRGYNLE